MKKHNKKKTWKPLIIFIWIVFLVAAGIGCNSLQRANVYEKATTELKDQAEIISRQFANLVDTNFYTRAGLHERQLSELKTISYVLENYDDIDQADDFLEDIINTTEVKNLWVYDRNGNILFGSGPAPEYAPEPDEIAAILDLKTYETIEGTYNESERYWTATYFFEEDNSGFVWGVKDQWLVYAEDPFSDELKKIVRFLDWNNALQDISIGRDGIVLAVSAIDGSVLSYPDSSFVGKPVEDLNIRIAGKEEAASVDRLLEEFSNTDDIQLIEVGSVRCYATRMEIDDDLFLVMFPEEAIEKEVNSETLILMVPLALITGIGVLYVFCLAAESSEQAKKNSGKKRSPLVSAGKLKVFTLLAVILMLILSLYLETHFVYARMFQYTSTTAEDVMQKKRDSDKMLKEIQALLESGNLEKCRIARCAIQDAPAGKLDRQYVTDLADRLDANALYVFDKDGKVSLTNAPYDGYIIDEKSPFFALLEGKEFLVVQPNPEETAGDALQGSGVTMIDESNRVEGAIVIADRYYSMVADSLSYDAVFERVFLKDNTVVMAINSENKTVRYFAQVDGSFLESDQYSYDYSQMDAAALGLDENQLRDHFNGEMFAIENQFFASVRRTDNDFVIVLRPLVFLDAGNLLSIVFVTVSTLIFFILMLCVTGRLEVISEEESGEADDQAEGEKKPESSAPDINQDKDEDDVITLLKKLADNEKYEFEERWPSDGKKWRDKNPMEKYSTTVKLICIAVLALIVVRVLVAGKDSIFYYSFHGEWSNGVNLYSITSCIIVIILLFLLKEIIHKVLFLIARASQSRGETICHLLNSFTGYVLFIAGIFIILAGFGVNVTTMSLTAGVAGIIFGIGCQNIVADILAGIIMTFEGVACAGDFISYNGRYAVIQSVGVRTTKLKRYGEITVVRNNEFKNYINLPAEETSRVIVYLLIDFRQSLSLMQIGSAIENEIPQIRDTISQRVKENIRLKFRGVQDIEDSGIKLSFAVYCSGMYCGWVRRLLNQELLLMCERNGIRLALPQIVVNEPEDVDKDSDS